MGPGQVVGIDQAEAVHTQKACPESAWLRSTACWGVGRAYCCSWKAPALWGQGRLSASTRLRPCACIRQALLLQ